MYKLQILIMIVFIIIIICTIIAHERYIKTSIKYMYDTCLNSKETCKNKIMKIKDKSLLCRYATIINKLSYVEKSNIIKVFLKRKNF